MKFLIITHVIHTKRQENFYAYEPYVREMNIWLKYVDEVIIIAPLVKEYPTAIDSFYTHSNIDFRIVPAFSLTSFRNSVEAIFKIPSIIISLFKAMRQADHIHLRCPGNMGLLACFLQIFFPSKPKTAKYAGNWAPNAQQPWSYRVQKWILSNSFLTRNMKVLVYGEWINQSANIHPFFTASYSEVEGTLIKKTISSESVIRLIFVGSLVVGKNPLYAIQLLEQLRGKGINAKLALYGDGMLREDLMDYIVTNKLEDVVILHGNQNQEVLKKAYQQSHFVILASKSEGWPKAIAEGMFWGCVPLVTAVSCVPQMLDYGKRGILLQMDLENDVSAIITLVKNAIEFESLSMAAMNWSRKYTMEYFENEIQKLLK